MREGRSRGAALFRLQPAKRMQRPAIADPVSPRMIRPRRHPSRDLRRPPPGLDPLERARREPYLSAGPQRVGFGSRGCTHVGRDVGDLRLVPCSPDVEAMAMSQRAIRRLTSATLGDAAQSRHPDTASSSCNGVARTTRFRAVTVTATRLWQPPVVNDPWRSSSPGPFAVPLGDHVLDALAHLHPVMERRGVEAAVGPAVVPARAACRFRAGTILSITLNRVAPPASTSLR